MECGGVRRPRMVALDSTTLLSMRILVYSGRRFGYSSLTPLVKNQFYICQVLLHVFVSESVQARYIQVVVRG